MQNQNDATSFLENFLDTSGSDYSLNQALSFNRSLTKRIFDLGASLVGMLFLSPVFGLIAVLIKLDSPGPAIYQQVRVGFRGKLFKMYKFRTMYADSDDALHKDHILKYAQAQLDGAEGFKLANDPRITKIGGFLRKTSLDEMPQLINVIKGEMSLVGPRPVPVYEADLYNLWQSERINVLPGITGIWQVLGRSSVSFNDQIRMDIRYVRNQSLLLNIKIIIATVLAVISEKGAG